MTWIQYHFDLTPKWGNCGRAMLSLLASPGKSTGSARWRVKFYISASATIKAALVTDY
jgi:hypothetical protein